MQLVNVHVHICMYVLHYPVRIAQQGYIEVGQKMSCLSELHTFMDCFNC